MLLVSEIFTYKVPRVSCYCFVVVVVIIHALYLSYKRADLLYHSK